MMNEIESILYGERFSHLPHWKFIDIENVSQNLPSFLYCEIFFGVLFFLSFCHACFMQTSYAKKKYQLCLFLSSLLGGVGNDVIFTFLPLVDNFWHSQGTVMLSPRFPLYILFWYAGWLYIPFTIVSNMEVSQISPYIEAVLVSLLSACYYLPWDYVGVKFVWWTWHTTDNALGERWLGVPSASTLWTLTFGYVWALVVRKSLGEPNSIGPSWGVFFRTLGSAFTLSVPGMMICINLLGGLLTFHLPPPPTSLSVLFTTVLLLSTFVFSLGQGGWPKPQFNRLDIDNVWILRLGVRLHFLFLFGTLLLFDPSNHISTGVHQEFGPCSVKELDISGLIRSKFTCSDDLAKPFVEHSWQTCNVFNESNRNAILPSIDNNATHWYSVCGKEKGEDWYVHACVVVGSTFVFFESIVGYFLRVKK